MTDLSPLQPLDWLGVPIRVERPTEEMAAAYRAAKAVDDGVRVPLELLAREDAVDRIVSAWLQRDGEFGGGEASFNELRGALRALGVSDEEFHRVTEDGEYDG